MNKSTLILAVTTMTFALTAGAQTPKAPLSQWVPLSNTLYILQPQERGEIYLGANIDTRTHDVTINIFDVSKTRCKAGESSEASNGTPLSINGQYVKVITGCINGTGITQPKTDTGKRFLNAEVASGRPVTLDDGSGHPLHFPASNLGPVKAKLLAVQRAM